ncbi:hypothetical protein PV326_009591 [Microctonus aethiopoides]|nr:hypothetical protein PV326_009591 [Microctonus aethiopoides]
MFEALKLDRNNGQRKARARCGASVSDGLIEKELNTGDGETIQDEKPSEDGDKAEESIKPETSNGDQGEVLLKFGSDVIDWKNSHTHCVKVSKTNDPHPIPGEPFFYNKTEDYSLILEQNCRDIGLALTEIWPSDAKHPVVTSNVKEKTLYDMRTWGRIACDEDAKLNAASILLVGEKTHWYHSLNEYASDSDEEEPNLELISPEDESLTINEEINVQDTASSEVEPYDNDLKQRKECIPLDVSRLKQYSLFPGQIVGIEGRNPTRDVLCAYNITNGVLFSAPPPPKLNAPLQIVVGAGPFTSNDSSDFQLLYNIMSYVAKNEPNVLILVGPFIPDSFTWVNNAKNQQTYQQLFENLIEKIMGFVEGKCTQVIMIASHEDVHHDAFYPTPEYSIRNSLKRPNLHLMPDPCMLDIDGLIIGITSVDIIRHLSSEEISYGMPRTNRLGRLAEHLLYQASFYPLYPPPPEVPLDIETWADCGVMHRVPHMLLLPSAMRHYHKWSNGTFIMNPSKACKGAFTRLIISPSDDEKNIISGEVLKLQK